MFDKTRLRDVCEKLAAILDELQAMSDEAESAPAVSALPEAPRRPRAWRPAPTDVIRLLIDYNPKRDESRKRFDLYRDGMTVADYVDAVVNSGTIGATVGKAYADLRWDTDRSSIAVG